MPLDAQLNLFRDDYRLREKVSTRARSIRIEVREPRDVLLVYPRWVARAEALAFLRSREAWVRAKLAELDARGAGDPPPARWDGGDEILWRGERVPVLIEAATLRQIQVRIEPQRVTLFAPRAACAQAHKLELALKRELMHHAGVESRRLLDAEAARLGVRWTRLSIADPRSQWGSCAPDGTVSLSWRLIMAPPPVLRYVVVHELCHRVHMDHSAHFWSLVAQQLPDYLQHKAWLREHGQRLHVYLPRRRHADTGHDGAIHGADFR
ncbi:SprT family zinc-dependent metalloprotease [Fontimonas sp. SYSU GA230001]|uniref:M48 family metallopeptidase n=1 Tax=Fontimonas sp. SYSU GA230001 TaxID=3142450 RepID=UPI0032B374D0